MKKVAKSYMRILLGTFILLGLFAVPGFASATSCDSRTITGYVITNGNDTDARFNYGTDYYTVSVGNGTKTQIQYVAKDQDRNIDQLITGLSGDTQYFYALQVKKTSSQRWITLDVENFTTPSCGTPPPNCSDIAANLSGRITSTGSPAAATIRNNSSCTYTVSFASYEQYSTGADWISTQKLFDSSTKTVGPNATVNFSVSVPSCRYQLDLVEGYPLTPPDYGGAGYFFEAEFGGGPLFGTMPPQNILPQGYLDQADCTQIVGWAQDENSLNSPVTVKIYDGGKFIVSLLANKSRSDLNGNYAFGISTPSAFRDSDTHTVRAYAIDNETGVSKELNRSGKTISACVTPPPPPPPNVYQCNDGRDNDGDGKVDMNDPGCSSPTDDNEYNKIQPPPVQTCQDPSAINYGGSLPCRYENFPSVTLTASDTSIDFGGTNTLFWTVQNATSCSTSGDWSGNVSPSGGSQVVGPLFSNKTYNITCSNSVGSDNDSITINVGGNDGDRPDVTTRSATNIDRDEATLRGEVDGNGLSTRVWFEWSDDRDEVEDGDGEETDEISTGSGSDDFSENIDGLDEDTTYYFRAVARNSEGTDYGSVLSFRTDEDDDNDDGDRPSVSIFSNPSNVSYGGAGTVTWNSSDADSCRASNGTNGWSGSRSRSGTFYTGTLYNNTTFSITCENDEGTDSDSTTITVGNIIAPQSRPTVILYAGQTSVPYNGATTIYWSTVGATTCQASGGSVGWAGAKSIGPGSFFTGSLTASRTYTLTCYNNAGSDTASVTVSVRPTGGPLPPPATSLVLVTSSVDRTQPIIPTLDNTKPCPGDEINYTITYQNIGTGAVRSLVLRLDLPFEVSYMFSNPNNPTIAGNTLTFNLGTLGANSQGTVTVRVRVRDDAPIGANLNFPALLSYLDPAGSAQTVTANVVAQVWCEALEPLEVEARATSLLGANVFGAGFWPDTLFEWLLLLILVLLLILLIRYLIVGATAPLLPSRRTTTTTVEHN